MRLPLLLLVLAFASASSVLAQQPPYDKPLPVEPPYYRVRYEPSTKPGELVYGVNYVLWVPPKVKALRGIVVHQHGCGTGSCLSGQTGAFDLHWQALAQAHDCALLSPSYEQPDKTNCQMWCDPRKGSAKAFFNALEDFAEQSGHTELPTLPLAMWGHSGGGHWVGGMTLLYPERVIATWNRSGVPSFDPEETRYDPYLEIKPEVLKVPIMVNLGTKEGVSVTNGRFKGVWPNVQAYFAKLRPMGAHIGIAIDPLTSHECGNQRYLAMPWFDACLKMRLPKQPGEPLKMIPEGSGYLATLQTDPQQITPAIPASRYSGEHAKALWLPEATSAKAWFEFVVDNKITDQTAPAKPVDLTINGKVLTWNSQADLQSGISHFLIYRDGELLTQYPQKVTNRFGRPLFQGLQYSDTPVQPLTEMKFVDQTADSSKTHQYEIKAVNTVGLVSE